MIAPTLGERVGEWARKEPTIQLVAIIGSRARPSTSSAPADHYSDWDFQLVTADPQKFEDSRWADDLGLQPLVYVSRLGRLGSAQKVTALFDEGELDLVVIPAATFRGLAQLVRARQFEQNPAIRQALVDQAAVLQGGYQILKGAEEFKDIYDYVATEISPPRLSDATIVTLANGFVCDYVSTYRKIGRGELMAAQRWLHHHLAEANFRLLQELRLREGRTAFPDARRLELLGDSRAAMLAVSATPSRDGLCEAVEKSAAACRSLIRSLIGERWQWPVLSTLRLRAE